MKCLCQHYNYCGKKLSSYRSFGGKDYWHRAILTTMVHILSQIVSPWFQLLAFKLENTYDITDGMIVMPLAHSYCG